MKSIKVLTAVALATLSLVAVAADKPAEKKLADKSATAASAPAPASKASAPAAAAASKDKPHPKVITPKEKAEKAEAKKA